MTGPFGLDVTTQPLSFYVATNVVIGTSAMNKRPIYLAEAG